MLAKGDRDNQSVEPIRAGGISTSVDRQPIINGKIAAPGDRPLINGIILKDPQPIDPSVDKEQPIDPIVVPANRHR